jgi:hypothetical protein
MEVLMHSNALDLYIIDGCAAAIFLMDYVVFCVMSTFGEDCRETFRALTA